jgi:hypothetical protein
MSLDYETNVNIPTITLTKLFGGIVQTTEMTWPISDPGHF